MKSASMLQWACQAPPLYYFFLWVSISMHSSCRSSSRDVTRISRQEGVSRMDGSLQQLFKFAPDVQSQGSRR